MAAQVAGVFEDNLRQKILDSKVLVVGAGGIGCEILKNLVLSGFPDIEIIDLDTIDVSNLNRQFLFHKEHVGKSKAEVARQSALKFNPNVNIKAYHDSITTTNYGVSFFQRFNLVLNALDNRQARNHVNRMCLSANIPLIESGTAGYNGQVELIKKDLTQCYECTPKQTEKTYPNCTIRNTPSELIHCIVWAKHLFNQLFGEVIDEEDISPDTTDPEAAGDAGKNSLTTEANNDGNIQRSSTRQWAEQIQYDSAKLFNKLFNDDIKYLLSMKDLWKKRTPPEPLKWEDCIEFADKKQQLENITESLVVSDQKIWNILECAKAFSNSVKALQNQLSKLTEGDHLVWDKDDRNAMDFVASCANIRAHIFKIPQKSRFEIKSMAGNIIPAIATTNAITAGIVIMHAFKVLQGQFDKCKSVYMRLRPNARNQLFVPDKFLNPPNPKCFTCSKHEVTLKIDTNKMTIKEFRENVLIKGLNMISPDVTVTSTCSIILSSEEDEIEMNDEKFLNEMKVFDGSILDADDYVQQYKLRIIIIHEDAQRDKPLFEIIADPDSLKPQEEEKNEINENGVKQTADKNDKNESTAEAEENIEEKIKRQKLDESADDKKMEEDDDDVCIVVENEKNPEVPSTSAGVKRKNDPGEGPSTSKRAKISEHEDDDLIILDDD